jgi:hypothetical protein
MCAVVGDNLSIYHVKLAFQRARARARARERKHARKELTNYSLADRV